MASDALKALQYAEDTLQVHDVFRDVVDELNDLDKTFADLDKAQDRRRELDDQYADREVELVHEMRGVHPNMSDTRFKTEFKVWEREDKKLRELRIELNKVRSEIQGLEYDAEMQKLRIKVGSSRMDELGGYLHYLAAVKNQAEKKTQRSGDRV